jgi:hypothetical protein
VDKIIIIMKINLHALSLSQRRPHSRSFDVLIALS